MKNYKYIFLLSIVVLIASCKKIEDPVPSIPGSVSLPYLVEQYADGSYGFGLGSNTIFTTIPDTIALVADTVLGFPGGFGGKTGHDFIYLLKSDVKGGWPDTTALGGASLVFEKYNSNNYKIQVVVNIVVAEPIKAPQSPGPTDLEGTYTRPLTGLKFTLVKIYPGVYLLGNPGAGGVDPYPYVLKNYSDVNGKDSLSFENQPNPCGGGTMLVGPTGPSGLSAAEYSATYPPTVTSLSPITLSWKVFEFPEATPESVHTGAALCQWGLAIRTFTKD